MSPENSRMLQYFVPILGNAPKWCSYMEALTEELEETDNNAGTRFLKDFEFFL